MAAQTILVLAEDPTDGTHLAFELSREHYAAQSADFRDALHLGMTEPDLVIACLPPRLEPALDLVKALTTMKNIPLLVICAPGRPEVESPHGKLPGVTAVLPRHYSRESLLAAVKDALAAPAAGPSDLLREDASRAHA